MRDVVVIVVMVAGVAIFLSGPLMRALRRLGRTRVRRGLERDFASMGWTPGVPERGDLVWRGPDGEVVRVTPTLGWCVVVEVPVASVEGWGWSLCRDPEESLTLEEAFRVTGDEEIGARALAHNEAATLEWARLCWPHDNLTVTLGEEGVRWVGYMFEEFYTSDGMRRSMLPVRDLARGAKAYAGGLEGAPVGDLWEVWAQESARLTRRVGLEALLAKGSERARSQAREEGVWASVLAAWSPEATPEERMRLIERVPDSSARVLARALVTEVSWEVLMEVTHRGEGDPLRAYLFGFEPDQGTGASGDPVRAFLEVGEAGRAAWGEEAWCRWWWPTRGLALRGALRVRVEERWQGWSELEREFVASLWEEDARTFEEVMEGLRP